MSVRSAERSSGDRAPTVSLSAAMRRLAGVAERASDPDQVQRAMAHELMVVTGADEVALYKLDSHRASGEGAGDLVVVYLFNGESRLSYVSPRSDRPAAVSWVASTSRSFLATGERELAASLPQMSKGPAAVRCALLCPLVIRDTVEAVVLLASRDQERFDAASCEQAGTLIEQAATAIALGEARLEAGTDAVTGCMNHRAMRRRLQEEVGRAGRARSRLSCMLIDLDDFKRVNDRHGHRAGDTLLRGVAQTLMGEFRAFDLVARYGGDEFVVILPEADLDRACLAAERALERLATISIVDAEKVGASIGVAEWDRSMSIDDLLEACDRALLAGKRKGKNRVTTAR